MLKCQPLVLEKTRQGAVRSHATRIDLRVGDEAFDAAFTVEAVPSDLAKALLDECTRTALLVPRPWRVTIARGELRFMTNVFLDTPDQIAQVVELCVQTAMRLPALPADVRAKRLNETAQQVGYRGPDPEALHAVDPATLESPEVAASSRHERDGAGATPSSSRPRLASGLWRGSGLLW